MASRFVNPFPQFMDATPTMRAGAKLFFYAAGTSTKLNTYSDKALTSPNTNPVVLNSAGYSNTDVYLQDLDYKVVFAPSTDTDPPTSPIWTADYVRGRDSALIAKTLTGSGSPNGVVAGTAGSASILPDFYWDYTNSILYVCTTTGTTSTAVWTAVNASSATAAVPPPQGRLTLTSATPVLAADVVAATAVYYTPFIGNLAPIYNGASMIPTEFSELTLTLSASHALNTLYDVFVFSNSGVLTLATGPAWTTSTAGSGARGSGAGTTQLTRIKGLWVNAVSMTGRNGASTYSIGANLATYLGSIAVDGTAGQITSHVTIGQSRKAGLWNAYNRNRITLLATDPSSAWTTVPATWRQSRGDPGNSVTALCGLPEEAVSIVFNQSVTVPTTAGNTVSANIGIGINSTTSPTGMVGTNSVGLTGGTTSTVISILAASASFAPAIGINKFNGIEQSSTVAPTYNATSTNMNFSVSWMG